MPQYRKPTRRFVVIGDILRETQDMVPFVAVPSENLTPDASLQFLNLLCTDGCLP